MKRKILLVTCLLLVLLLGACGKKEKPESASQNETVTENPTSIQDTFLKEEAPDDLEASNIIEAADTLDDTNVSDISGTSDVSDIQNEESEQEKTPDVKLPVGIIHDNIYENESLEIGCKFDENWTLESQEALLSKNQMASDLLNDKYASVLEGGNISVDLVAVNKNHMSIVAVGLEEIKNESSLGDETHLIGIEEQMNAIFGVMGADNMQSYEESIDFIGKKHSSVLVQAEYMTIPVYQRMILIEKEGYVCCVVACTWQKDTTKDVLASFYALP